MDSEEICNAMQTLTPREREVMNGVVSGLLNKEIASELRITERTVKAHRGRVMAKMGAKSSAELIKMLLTIQLNGKEQKANVQSMMSPENAGALKIIADLLQTTPEAFSNIWFSGTSGARSTPGALNIFADGDWRPLHFFTP